MNFIYSVQSEWLKTKRSAASWLCLVGGFFVPLIVIIVYLKNQNSINEYYPNHDVWKRHLMQLWRNMGTFILPMGVILASSLATQMEFKNNTWKQLHTTPQSFTSVFFSKLTVIILLTVKFFIFFNIGVILSGIIPALLFTHSLPVMPLPFKFFVIINAKIFLSCLPLIAIQYLISLQFKNFLVPIGAGLLGLIGSLFGMSWKYIYISPFIYSPMLVSGEHREIPIYWYSFFYFLIITAVSYLLYINKKEKG